MSAVRDLVEGEFRRNSGPLSKEALQEATALASGDLRDVLGELREEGLLSEREEGFELVNPTLVERVRDWAEAALPIPRDAQVASGPDGEPDDSPRPPSEPVGAVWPDDSPVDAEVVEGTRVQGEVAHLAASEYVTRILVEVRFQPLRRAMPPMPPIEPDGPPREVFSPGIDAIAVEAANALRAEVAAGLADSGVPMAEFGEVSTTVESVEAVARRRVFP